MQVLFTVLVTFFAGMGAGLGTGFAGMSAAAVISPMLITFLDMDPYMAVGIALSSDVLASAVSAYTYGRNKNLDVRNGLIMMASVLAFTVVGSYIASLVPSTTMGGFSVFMTFLLGVKFILRPVMTTKETMMAVSARKRAVQSVVCGMLIGFICGFVHRTQFYRIRYCVLTQNLWRTTQLGWRRCAANDRRISSCRRSVCAMLFPVCARRTAPSLFWRSHGKRMRRTACLMQKASRIWRCTRFTACSAASRCCPSVRKSSAIPAERLR